MVMVDNGGAGGSGEQECREEDRGKRREWRRREKGWLLWRCWSRGGDALGGDGEEAGEGGDAA